MKGRYNMATANVGWVGHPQTGQITDAPVTKGTKVQVKTSSNTVETYEALADGPGKSVEWKRIQGAGDVEQAPKDVVQAGNPKSVKGFMPFKRHGSSGNWIYKSDSDGKFYIISSGIGTDTGPKATEVDVNGVPIKSGTGTGGGVVDGLDGPKPKSGPGFYAKIWNVVQKFAPPHWNAEWILSQEEQGEPGFQNMVEKVVPYIKKRTGQQGWLNWARWLKSKGIPVPGTEGQQQKSGQQQSGQQQQGPQLWPEDQKRLNSLLGKSAPMGKAGYSKPFSPGDIEQLKKLILSAQDEEGNIDPARLQYGIKKIKFDGIGNDETAKRVMAARAFGYDYQESGKGLPISHGNARIEAIERGAKERAVNKEYDKGKAGNIDKAELTEDFAAQGRKPEVKPEVKLGNADGGLVGHPEGIEKQNILEGIKFAGRF